jgi:tripartite-type tricarboxylate transporter receptor subunit TctC
MTSGTLSTFPTGAMSRTKSKLSLPSEIIATLNKQTNAAVLDSNIKQRFADLGAVAVAPNSPDEFARFIAENIDKWTKVIKFAGIKPQ